MQVCALSLLAYLAFQRAVVGAAYLRVHTVEDTIENDMVIDHPRERPMPDGFPRPGSKIQIPEGKTHVEINIGTHSSPIPRSDEQTFLILVEPNPKWAQTIKEEKKGDAIYQVAISNFTGDAQFHLYGGSGGSASLSMASHAADWNAKHSVINVKVHTLKELLDAVPTNVPITFLKTDLQGHDLNAIKSAGWSVTRAESIMAEVFGPREATYSGVDNSYPSWAKYMNKIGYDSGIDPRTRKPCRLLLDARDYAEQDCLFEKRNKRRTPAKAHAKHAV